jgi:hypothetical protein
MFKVVEMEVYVQRSENIRFLELDTTRKQIQINSLASLSPM